MKYFLWGLLFFLVAYLIPIAGRPLHRPDEFRYAEIPREMIESGNFVTPRLLGVRYFEKPVMGYWLVAGSFKIFGQNRFSLRLPMALAAGLTALLLGLWIKRSSRDPEWALWAALFYLATGLGWALGTTGVLDSILCLFTTATLICVHQAVMTEKWNFERLIWLVLCGVTAGLGFMTKGFVAWAVPGCAAVAWLLWSKRFMALLWLPWIPLLVMAATVAPWALEIHRAEPDFWHYFVVVEHLQRFKSSAETQHPEPFWFYIPVLPGTLLPALITVFPAAAAGKELWKKVWKNNLWRFAFCGFLLPFCFFSASTGKLATYILVCYPFVSALLVLPALEALRAERRGAQLTVKWSFDIAGVLLFVLGAAEIAFGLALLPPVRLQRFIPVLDGGAVMFILLGLASAAGGFWQLRNRNSVPLRIAGFFGFFALTAAAVAALPDFGSDKMPERYLRQFADEGRFDPRQAVIFTNGQMGHAVAWTFHRPDTMLMDSAGEMDYGVAAAKKEGNPKKLMSPEVGKLLRRPDRPEVVYMAAYDPDDDYRYRRLLKYDPRIWINGPVILLVFPKPSPTTEACPARPAR